MKQGIVLLGLNGCGKSTLAHRLAKELGYFEMDVEDYYFPGQRENRRKALEGEQIPFEEQPYGDALSGEEVEQALLRDMENHPRFVLAGVKASWGEAVLDKIGMAFLLTAPTQERVRRVQAREEVRFGPRVLPGGDLYEQQREFRSLIAARDEQTVRDSTERLSCPVIELDGTEPVEQNAERIKEQIRCHGKSFY